MKGRKRKPRAAKMLKEYDFSRGVRGKYVRRYSSGTMAIVLDRDVARVFSDANSVNEALRALAAIIRRQRRKNP